MSERVPNSHNTIESKNINIILAGLWWQLQIPALHSLLDAEDRQTRNYGDPHQMPDRDGLADSVEHVDEHEYREERVHHEVHELDPSFDCLLILLCRLVRHLLVILSANLYLLTSVYAGCMINQFILPAKFRHRNKSIMQYSTSSLLFIYFYIYIYY